MDALHLDYHPTGSFTNPGFQLLNNVVDGRLQYVLLFQGLKHSLRFTPEKWRGDGGSTGRVDLLHLYAGTSTALYCCVCSSCTIVSVISGIRSLSTLNTSTSSSFSSARYSFKYPRGALRWRFIRDSLGTLGEGPPLPLRSQVSASFSSAITGERFAMTVCFYTSRSKTRLKDSCLQNMPVQARGQRKKVMSNEHAWWQVG